LLVAAGVNVSTPIPTGVARNSLAFTQVANQTDTHGGGGIFNASWWYLDNPTVGTFNTVVTWVNSTSGAGACAIPLTNVDLSRPPICGAGNDAINSSASCVVSATNNDLQLGMVHARSTTMVSAGAPQSVVSAAPALPRLSINGLNAFSVDVITAGNPGNFAWTTTSGIWVALGITVYGQASGTGPSARCIYIMP
jgi:hypothetical protein